MLKIFVKDNSSNVFILKHPSPYSIITEPSKVYLSTGLNEIHDLSYGFNLVSGIGNSKFIYHIDLSDYDTSNIIDMSTMFLTYSSSSLDLSSFDTRNVTDMYGMFAWCGNLEKLDLSSFDTSNVTNATFMFLGCRSLSELDLSNFDMSNVKDYINMFNGCVSLRLIKCSKNFKKWCLDNRHDIMLPPSMREGGNGIWETID